jgi:hypothetical protein
MPWAGPGQAGPSPWAGEHLDVVLQLFDSWDEDALVFDKAAAVFADRDKVRRIRHSGAFFTVDGPLNAPRPPQGRPVLIQRLADASAYADVVLIDLNAPAWAAPPPKGGRLRIAEMAADLGADPVTRCADLAERLAGAFPSRCDGFLLVPADPLVDIPVLAETLAPRLRALGLLIQPPQGVDFRTRLGLARPANRFASSPQAGAPEPSP